MEKKIAFLLRNIINLINGGMRQRSISMRIILQCLNKKYENENFLKCENYKSHQRDSNSRLMLLCKASGSTSEYGGVLDNLKLRSIYNSFLIPNNVAYFQNMCIKINYL